MCSRVYLSLTAHVRMPVYVCTVYICVSQLRKHIGVQIGPLLIWGKVLPGSGLLLSLFTLKHEVESALGRVGILTLPRAGLQEELQLIPR